MFLDTSALIPLFTPESDSARCEAIVSGHPEGLVASELIIGEMTGAVLAKEKIRLLTTAQREAVMAKLDEQIAEGVLRLVPVNGVIVREAAEVMRQVYPDVLLRTLDAIHLATYLSIEAGPLFTRDKRMLDAARRLNLPLAGG